jgi:hypothetical protein
LLPKGSETYQRKRLLAVRRIAARGSGCKAYRMINENWLH